MLIAAWSFHAGMRADLWQLIPLQLVVLFGTGYECLVNTALASQDHISTV